VKNHILQSLRRWAAELALQDYACQNYGQGKPARMPRLPDQVQNL